MGIRPLATRPVPTKGDFVSLKQACREVAPLAGGLIVLALLFALINQFLFGIAWAEPARPTIENYRFGGPTCQSASPDVFVTGVWGNDSPGVVALQRADTDGAYHTVSNNAVANINGKQYPDRGWVAVKHGDLFEVRQTLSINDAGDYRIVAAEGSAPLMGQERPVIVLDQFSAMRPSAGFCREVQSAK